MLQLPSNSARNLHGNSAASAGGRASAAHPRGDTRGQLPRHGHSSLCWPPSTARGAGALPGEREPRGTPGSGVQPAPTLCGGVPLLWRLEAHGQAPGTAWQWTAHLLLWNNTAQQRCTRRLNKHSSQRWGTHLKHQEPELAIPVANPLEILDVQESQAGWLPSPGMLGIVWVLAAGETGEALPRQTNSAAWWGGPGGGFTLGLCTHRSSLSISHNSMGTPRGASTGQSGDRLCHSPAGWRAGERWGLLEMREIQILGNQPQPWEGERMGQWENLLPGKTTGRQEIQSYLWGCSPPWFASFTARAGF